MATALTTFYTDKKQRYLDLLSTATDTLSTASADLAAAKTDRSAIVAALGALDTEIAALRASMAAGDLMPSEIESLAEQLRGLLIDRRQTNAELVASEEAVARAELDKTTQAELVAQYQALADDAADELAEIETIGDQHTQWLHTDTETAVQTLVTEAQALIAGMGGPAPGGTELTDEQQRLKTIVDATARISADIPGVLLTRARTRDAALVTDYRAALKTHYTAVEDAEATYLAAHDGDAGALQQAWLDYERIEQQLREAALNTQRSFDKAIANLESVVNSEALSTAETDRIAAVAIAGGADPLVKEEEEQAVLAAIAAKKLELELAVVNARIADIDADPATDATVQTLQGELDTLENTDLPAAQSANTQAMRDELDAWEASVPDRIWSNLVKYDEAIAALSAIEMLDFPTLKSDFNTQETALVSALAAEDANNRVNIAVAAAVTKASGVSTFIKNNAYQRRLSVVKGDS